MSTQSPFPSMRRRRFLTLLGGAAAASATSVLRAPFGLPLGMGVASADPKALAGTLDWPGGFPLDPKIAAQVLQAARSQGAPFAELYVELRTRTRISLADSLIESVEQGIFSGCGVRVLDGERTGYAYADAFTLEPLLAAAKNAAAIAASPGAGAIAAPDFKPSIAAPGFVRCARPLDQLPADERVDWIQRADRAARAYAKEVQQVTIEHTDEMCRFAVINSEGLWVQDAMPLIYVRIDVVASKGEKRGAGFERLSKRLGAEQMAGDVPERGGREAARMAVAMIEAEPTPAGEMPVVLAAGGGVLFHEAVGHGLEGDGVRLKTSFYTGRVGERVGAEQVSLYDTGAVPELRGSYNVDDEGTRPVENNLLIEKGILRGFLTDRLTADLLSLPRTGNGRRESYRYPPLVRMSNTYLGTGDDAPEDIIKSTKRGLYARALGGGEVNTTTGNFTFGVREGYLIEDGKITKPLRGANLVGKGPDVMQRIDRVGPDQKYWCGTCGKGQWVPVTTGSPTLRIAAMTVGGSEQS